MTNITPLYDNSEELSEEYKNAQAFEEFWKWYPHNPRRRDKAKARALFNKIIQPGGHKTKSANKDSGGYEELHLQATPEQIVEGVKRYRKSLIPEASGQYAPDTTYAPYAYVWLNGGRWDD